LSSRRLIVRGEIVSSTPITGSLMVELSGNGSDISESVSLNPDNSFEFRSATPGTHELRVLGVSGEVLYREQVSITGPNQMLSIHLPETNKASRAAGNTISIQQLQHKVPPRAQKAYDKGEQAASKGNLSDAETSFREAVNIDPEFADAYNELGATESRLQHLEDAAEQFQKAINLAPEHPQALPNLSIVLAKLRRWHEAGAVARRALGVVPASGRIHYILAASLLAERGGTEETIEHFKRAASEVPSARLTLAELLMQSGRRQEAIGQLEEYLSGAKADDALRPRVETRLAQLRRLEKD
jgi:tetratricopeptide (TPR) repeat protein